MHNISKIQHGRPSKEYGVGRKCAYPGCSHTLSRYNPDNICGSHTMFRPVLGTLDFPEEMKICSNCGDMKPATTEFFRRRHSRLEAQCKSCVNLKRRERKESKIEKDGLRRFTECGKVWIRDELNFRPSSADPKGFETVCIHCVRKKWTQASRESRLRRALLLKED